MRADTVYPVSTDELTIMLRREVTCQEKDMLRKETY